jgi:glycosyltransferase involved in cell wall biosynthesis
MKSNKKTAIICNYVLTPDRIGGMDRFFWLFDQKCKAEGHTVSWYFPNTSSYGQYENLNMIDSKGNQLEAFFIEHIKENNLKYDTIVTHFVELCTPFYKKIKSHYPSKIICVDHNPRPIGGYALKKKINKRIKGFLYTKYIDIFVCVSESTLKCLMIDFGNQVAPKAKIIYNGIDVEKYLLKDNFNKTNNFIVACHLRKEKGIQDLILAVKDIVCSRKDIDFKIDIFGKGDYEMVLKQMIKEYSLQKYFNFEGSVSNLYECYHKYDYLIHPSHGETFCYTVVESLLSNLPVITTQKEGNVLNLVKDNENGYVFEARNTSQLRNIIYKVIESNHIPHDFSIINMRKNDFSIEKMVQQHISIL